MPSATVWNESSWGLDEPIDGQSRLRFASNDMHSPDPPRRFRMPRWTRVLAGAASLVFLAVTAISWASNGWSWMTVVLLCLVPLAFAGFLDAVTSRVELHHDRMVVVRNLRRREYPRATFTKVTWGKGVPVALQ